jgi:hypothetical protein
MNLWNPSFENIRRGPNAAPTQNGNESKIKTEEKSDELHAK